MVVTNAEATSRTRSILVGVARNEFTQHGYAGVTIEGIVKKCTVTKGALYHHFASKKGLFLAVVQDAQRDVAHQIKQKIKQSEDLWQQLVLGCMGFIIGSNTDGCKRILLVDAPAVVGWNQWRDYTKGSLITFLELQIDKIYAQNKLADGVVLEYMLFSLSGAVNELALAYSSAEDEQEIYGTIFRLIEGFRKH